MERINIENMIREYFKKAKEFKDQELKLIEIRKKIEEYKEVLKGTNISFYIDLGCQQYSDDILGQGGRPISKVEQELERRYKQIEKYLAHYLRQESYTLDRIHNLGIDIEVIQNAFKELSPLEIDVITKRYKSKDSVKSIAHELFGGVEKTVYRINKKALEKLLNNIELSENCPKFVRKLSNFIMD